MKKLLLWWLQSKAIVENHVFVANNWRSHQLIKTPRFVSHNLYLFPTMWVVWCRMCLNVCVYMIFTWIAVYFASSYALFWNIRYCITIASCIQRRHFLDFVFYGFLCVFLFCLSRWLKHTVIFFQFYYGICIRARVSVYMQFLYICYFFLLLGALLRFVRFFFCTFHFLSFYSCFEIYTSLHSA